MRTSITHPLQVDSFPVTAGWVGMTLCPGRKGPSESGPDWDRDLAADVERLREWGATMVVSLTETAEMVRLGVADLGPAVSAAGMAWRHLPIPDTGTPGSTWLADWHDASPTIHQELQAGGRVVIHCRAGLERTALVAALLQCEAGEDPPTALSVIAATRAAARPLWNQQRWLETHLAAVDQQGRAESLDTFLLGHPAIATHTAVWADGLIRLAVSTHLLESTGGPASLTTSGRCIVLANDSVLVMQNPGGCHILPGGRIEHGEDSRLATIREVREESGLSLTQLVPLALMVFRHQTPRPPDYAYPYPVFTNEIFVSRLPCPSPIKSTDDYEQSGEFLTITQALTFLPHHERELLRATATIA